MLDGEWLYWSESGGRILRVERGGGLETVQVVANGVPDAYALAADCGAIYWTTFAFNHGTTYKVRRPD